MEVAGLVRGRLVGEGELVRERRASFSCHEACVVKEGSKLLPPMQVLSHVIKADVVEVDSGSCCQARCGFLKQI